MKKRVYVTIASFFGGQGLNGLLAILNNQILALKDRYDFNVLINRQYDSYPRGFPAAFNQMMNAAFTDPGAAYAWLASDDVTPGDYCLDVVLDAMEKDPSIGAMSPTEFWADGPSPMAVTSARFNIGQTDVWEHVYNYFSLVCISREAWQTVGPMDESLGRGYCEDIDWCIRCWRKGFRVTSHHRVQQLHDHQRTYKQIANKCPLKDEDNGFKNGIFQKRYPFFETDTEQDILNRMRADYEQARNR